MTHHPERYPLGPERGQQWLVSSEHVDMSAPLAAPRPVTFRAQPQNVTVDLERSALVVIDMQNDFCAKNGWVDHLGVDYTPDRAPIAPLQRLVPSLRRAGVHIVWVNWGNRPDLGNMPPNQIHLYKPHGRGIGARRPAARLGRARPRKGQLGGRARGRAEAEPSDYRVDKYRISGFWDTPLDSILKNLAVKSVFFAGVNTDQCVFCSLTDANFLGYGCILLRDCCATTSPSYCTEATLFNVKKCFGFVTDSGELLDGLKASR